jgi:hypothetical protein
VSEPVTLVDAHVHLHRRFDLAELLDAAARNFAAARGPGEVGTALLMFAEITGRPEISRLRRATGGAGAWRIEQTDEAVAFVARRDDVELGLIVGRQLVTAERLEVLSLAAEEPIPDGLPVRETLDAVGQAGGIPVLPWGVGKWSFARGRIVDALIAERGARDLFVGDNGGRLELLPRPARLARAEQLGMRVLSGTDPLPLAAECRRIGSFGLRLAAQPDLRRPAASLAAILRDRSIASATYGRAKAPLAFLRDQIALRLPH